MIYAIDSHGSWSEILVRLLTSISDPIPGYKASVTALDIGLCRNLWHWNSGCDCFKRYPVPAPSSPYLKASRPYLIAYTDRYMNWSQNNSSGPDMKKGWGVMQKSNLIEQTWGTGNCLKVLMLVGLCPTWTCCAAITGYQ